MYSKSLLIEQVGLYKGRMFAVKDCYGSQMMDITRDIKKELKVRGYCSKVDGRNYKTRDRISTHELTRPVHRTIEIRLFFNLTTAAACL